jgi:hypothetical protein
MTNGVRILRSLGFVFALISVLAFGAVVALGQAIDGNILGTVTDASGAAVVGADVTATNVATNVSATTKTNGSGEYRFDHLLVGTYRISAKMTGFKTINEMVDVELNKTGTRNISLVPGAATETVEVSGVPPTIDTTTAQITNSFDEVQTSSLPTATVGSGVNNLALYNAGVASPGGLGAGAGPALSGQRSRNNNFTIEGVDNNNVGVTGPLAVIPNDAVQGFTVLQNQFSAEFGHSSGGQFNQVVTSGTNSYHGRAYEYFQNKNLNAADALLERTGAFTKMPRYDNNRFGGQVGGPIIKNKLFFFFNFEYNPIGQAAIPATVCTPTSAGVSALNGISGLNANNLAMFEKYVPVAAAASTTCNAVAVNGTPIEVGNLSFQAPNFINNTSSASSVDFNISDKDQLRGRFIYNKQNATDIAAALPSFFTNQPFKSYVFTLSEYHSFSASMQNEVRIGYNRSYQNFPAGNFQFTGLDSFPNLTFDDLSLQVGPDPNAPQFQYQNVYQAVDNFSWTKGRHTLQLGIEGRKYLDPENFTQRARGDYDYATLETYLNDGTPESLAERSVGNPNYDGSKVALYWYVNDQIKLRPNLTLSLGLRHEYTTVPEGERLQKLNIAASVPGLIDFSEPRAPKKNFAPRVGLAWSPGHSGNTSVRAGFGMAYDILYDNIGQLAKPPQLNQTYDCPGSPTCPAGGFIASGAIPPTPAPFSTVAEQRAATANWIPPNEKDPYTISWNLSVERVFAKDYTAEVRYVGTRGVHLNTQNRPNTQNVVTPSFFLPTYINAPSQAELDSLTTTLDGPGGILDVYNNGNGGLGGSFVPAYANAGFTSLITAFLPYGSSAYHGLQTQLTRRFSHGLQMQVAYTWSHALDDSTADFFSTVLTPRRPQSFQCVHCDWSTSALDRRHRFTIVAVYDMPYFKHGSFVQKNVLGNWQITPAYTYESPELAAVQDARDTNLNFDSWPDRAIFNPAGKSGTGTTESPLTNTAGFVVAYVADDPTAQYIRGETGSLSNLRRNTLPTQHINNFDTSVYKSFSFGERMKLQVGIQLLNMFNHPQFIPGTLNDIKSFGQTATVVRNYLTPSRANFNDPTVTFSSNPRTTQLSAKFFF